MWLFQVLLQTYKHVFKISNCTIKGDFVLLTACCLYCTVQLLKDYSHCNPWVTMGTPCKLIRPTWGVRGAMKIKIFPFPQLKESYLTPKCHMKRTGHHRKISIIIVWWHEIPINLKRHVRFIFQMLTHKNLILMCSPWNSKWNVNSK